MIKNKKADWNEVKHDVVIYTLKKLMLSMYYPKSYVDISEKHKFTNSNFWDYTERNYGKNWKDKLEKYIKTNIDILMKLDFISQDMSTKLNDINIDIQSVTDKE